MNLIGLELWKKIITENYVFITCFINMCEKFKNTYLIEREREYVLTCWSCWPILWNDWLDNKCLLWCVASTLLQVTLKTLKSAVAWNTKYLRTGREGLPWWFILGRFETGMSFYINFFCSNLVKRIIGFLTQKQLIMNELITRLCISIGLFKIVIFFKHILSKWDFIDAFRIQSNFKINNKSLWNILFGLINDNVIFFNRAFNLKHKIQDVIC